MEETKGVVQSPDSKVSSTTRDPGSPTISQQSSASDDNDLEMAPGGKQRPNTPKREVDLGAILTANEKIEFTMLLTKVIDTMQKQITQAFDSTGLDDNQPARVSFWSRLPAHLRDQSISKPQQKEGPKRGQGKAGQTKKENVKPSRPMTATTPIMERPEDDSNTATECADQQTSKPRLQELKRDALQHFKKWQTALLKRVGDISVKRTADTQSVSSSSGLKKRPPFNNRTRSNGPRAPAVEPDPALKQLYPPTSTSLCSIPLEKRTLLLHSLLLLLLSMENYCAYSRVLLLHVASSFHLSLRTLAEDEVRMAKSLAQIAKDISPDDLAQKKSEEGKSSRRWKVGLASVAGAAVLGLTGGLAAPLVAAGIGTVLGGIGLGGTAAAGLLGSMAESTFIVGSLFGIYGARASGKAMDQYAKDVQDFAFVPLRGSIGEDSELGKVEPNSRRLRVVLGISGWLTSESGVVNPWRTLGQQSEVYAVRWEADALTKMGNALETVVKSAAWSTAKKEIIARTIFASLVQAMWPLGLLKISKIIDNPWSIGMVRADKAGCVLADVIMNKAQGERGVTLIGFSLGARVIYTCLTTLAERRAFGLVENVVMMGTPAPSDAKVWCAMKSVVSGRLINVYSENDYILGFLYRTSSILYGVAGLQKVEGIDGIENVDVSAKVSGHLRYQFLVGSILKHIGWEDIDNGQVAQDEELLSMVENKNRERERKRDAIELDLEVNKLEQEVKQKNEHQAIRTRARKAKGKK
ncbi:hypothetical protein B0T17DRAFT_357175 [Bombardia bombarda]|uniref:Uncharacterized protein n=1 Tax=Bombardia bombarda TaxID=252184 RepID=A0AA39WI43_9PEZI|nr:hypothetical protein B0T17DRAFT_357175 [Bombardia bombarda]